MSLHTDLVAIKPSRFEATYSLPEHGPDVLFSSTWNGTEYFATLDAKPYLICAFDRSINLDHIAIAFNHTKYCFTKFSVFVSKDNLGYKVVTENIENRYLTDKPINVMVRMKDVQYVLFNFLSNSNDSKLFTISQIDFFVRPQY